MAGAPFSEAVPADLPVFGIGGELFPVILAAASALAIGSAADCLSGLELGRLEDLLAVEATPFNHMKGVVSRRRHRLPPQSQFRNCCRVLPRPRQWFTVRLHRRGKCGRFKPVMTGDYYNDAEWASNTPINLVYTSGYYGESAPEVGYGSCTNASVGWIGRNDNVGDAVRFRCVH